MAMVKKNSNSAGKGVDLPTVEGRPAPQDLDAEGAVIAGVLLANDLVQNAGRMQLALVRPILKTEDFFSDANRWIYEACIALDDEGARIDVVTVAAKLKSLGKLEAVGGSAYIVQTLDKTPSTHNIEAHALIVRDAATQRVIIQEARQIASEGYHDVGDVAVWAANAVTRLDNASRVSSTKRGMTLKQATVNLMHRYQHNEDNISGVRTGIAPIDNYVGPMKPGQVTLVLAYTSQGKSAYCSSLVTNIATTHEHAKCVGTKDAKSCGWSGANPACKPDAGPISEYRCHKCSGELRGIRQGIIVFSQEMEPEEYAERIIAAHSQVEMRRCERGSATMDEWRDVTESAQACAVDHVRIVWDCFSIEDITIAAQQIAIEMQREGYPLRAIVIDYAQRVRVASAGRRLSTEEELSEVGRSVKELAMKLRVPIIMPAQLNDEARKKGERASAHNVRGCKALGMDADNVMIIYNQDRDNASSDYTETESTTVVHEPVDLIWDKVRGGRKGTVRACFIPSTTTFCAWQFSWGDPWADRKNQ